MAFLVNKLFLRGTLFAALSGTLYGVMGYFGIRLLQQQFSIPNMLFWRFFIAALWTAFILLLSNRSLLKIDFKSDFFLKTILFGVLTYSFGSAFYFLGSLYIGTGLAMVIFFVYPIFVTLFACLFSGFNINKFVVISLLAILVGLLLMNNLEKHIVNLGIVFAFLAALFYAIYIYLNQNSAIKVNPMLLTLSVCTGNAFIFLLVAFFSHSLSLPHTLTAWFYILAIGILATALPIQLLLNSLKYIDPVKASILSALEPVVTVVVGMAVLHEHISLLQAVGIIIILFGALFIQLEQLFSPAVAEG